MADLPISGLTRGTTPSGAEELAAVQSGETKRFPFSEVAASGPPAAHTHSGLVPAGGTTGQSLVKTSNGDYAIGWSTVSGGGGSTDVNAALAAGVGIINIDVYDPQGGPSASDRASIWVKTKVGPYGTQPQFTNVGGIVTELDVRQGRYSYGYNVGGQPFEQNKLTTYGIQTRITGKGSAQTFGYASVIRHYAMGDVATESKDLRYSGGPVAGDEGIGYSLVNWVMQQSNVPNTVVLSSSRSLGNTTATQNITRSQFSQTITVASTNNFAVGDYVVFDHHQPSSNMSMEVAKIEAMVAGTPGSITVKCTNDYVSGVTVKGCTRVVTVGIPEFGQGRTLVNMSGPTYTTGTYASRSGGAITLSGASLSNGMVGGDAGCIGAIAFTQDRHTTDPWSAGNAYDEYFLIKSISDANNFALFSNSVPGDASYRGKATAGGTFTIRPAARILMLDEDTHALILEPSAHTWANGNNIICALCPYPDVSGYTYILGGWAYGGTYRNGITLENRGSRTFGNAFTAGGNMPTGSDPWAWEIGMAVGGCKIGFSPTFCDVPILLSNGFATYGDRSGRIQWGADPGTHYIQTAYANNQYGFRFGKLSALGSQSSDLDVFSGAMRTNMYGVSGASGNDASPHILQWPGDVKSLGRHVTGTNEDICPFMSRATPPGANNAAGLRGEMRSNTTHLYVCLKEDQTANSWRRLVWDTGF